MNDNGDDAPAARPDQPRRVTTEGRTFGSVAYASEQARTSDELIRRASLSLADPVADRLSEPGPRVTGARTRLSERL